MTNKCIIPKKAVRHSCHTAFYIYKYRLNGNVDRLFCKDRANKVFCVCVSFVPKTIIINNTTSRKKV